jgi:hypothetical protein
MSPPARPTAASCPRRDGECAHPAFAIGFESEANSPVSAAERARKFRSAGALEERKVLGRSAVIHVGGRRKCAELECERCEAGVGDPGVIDARRTFRAAAAKFEQQAVVEGARDGALETEPRAPEIETITEVACRVVFAIGCSADRPATIVRGERTLLVLAIHCAIELHVGANRER